MPTDAPTASYRVPTGEYRIETEVKKSRFLARAAPCAGRAQAKALLQQARAEHPDAGHHCWAYLLGAPQQPRTAAMDDDGEPGGTAGRPILNVMQHQDVGDLMVIVSRYFGGVKLGAGGLVRAYSQAAQAVLQQLPTETLVPRLQRDLRGDFSQEQPLRHWAQQHDAQIDAVYYGQDVRIHLSLPAAELSRLHTFAAARGLRVFDGDEANPSSK